MRRILTLVLLAMVWFTNIAVAERITSGERLIAKIEARAEEKGSMEAALNIERSSLSAIGYGTDQTEEILRKAQAGEEIHPFHIVEYDVYNMPAEENGLEDDTLLVCGTIRKYVADGSKKNYSYGFVVEQGDGNQWLVYCAEKINGTLIGKRWGSDPEQHVFEGYEEHDVEIYGKYMGFSDKYGLPVIDIVTYGGMLDVDENAFIMTMTAGKNMRSYGETHRLDYLIGASSRIESTEPYYMR